MVDYDYKIVRFTRKDRAWFERLTEIGVINEPFDDFVKNSFYSKINEIRIKNITDSISDLRGDDIGSGL